MNNGKQLLGGIRIAKRATGNVICNNGINLYYITVLVETG